MLRMLARRLRAVFARTRLDDELDEEIQFHLDRESERHRVGGLGDEAARQAALHSFGGVARWKEQAREARGVGLVESAGKDLQHAARLLRRSPGFAAVVVSTLAIGMGACTALFSVVDRVLLRPPPFLEPQRVVVVQETLPARGEALPATAAMYHRWQREARSFQGLGAIMRVSAYALTGAGAPWHLGAARITASALPTLGLTLPLGRNFLAREEVPSGQEDVAILSHRLWQRRFGGRPQALGQVIRLDGRPFRVVGVMPADSALPAEVDVFAPLGFTARERGSYDGHWLEVVGRLAPGVTLAQAQSELEVIARRGAVDEPTQHRGWGATVVPIREAAVSDVRPVLLSLLGAVAFLLLLACANVANLLLARATARAREMAVRGALGASRARLVRQLVVESLLLSVLAGAGGVAIAVAALRGLLALAPGTLPRAAAIAVDGRALAFSFAVSVLTGLLFGLAPAYQAAGVSLQAVLKQSGWGTSEGPRRQRLRGALVVGEVAIALVLLAGAGLLMRSFSRLQAVDPGFQPQGALIATVFLPRPHYRAPAQYLAFADEAIGQLAALPGVTAAAAATNLPFAGAATRSFIVEGWPAAAGAVMPVARYQIVTPQYFRAMGIPLRRGRCFQPDDSGESRPVAIISEALARRFFPGQDPLGKRISLGGGAWREIVGVAGDVKASKLEGAGSPEIYQPFAQAPVWDFTLVVRGSPAISAGLLRAVAAVITAEDPDQPTHTIRPLADLVGDSIARQRLATTLFALFAATALLLAAIGIYGVMAYSVAQRTRELGIRMALGAQTGTVLRLVLLQGGRLIALGVLAGVGGALILARSLERLLFEVSAHDAPTFLAIVLLSSAVAALACLVPARRAASLSPMLALRRE
jgi:putative ABC transport system permease protein